MSFSDCSSCIFSSETKKKKKRMSLEHPEGRRRDRRGRRERGARSGGCNTPAFFVFNVPFNCSMSVVSWVLQAITSEREAESFSITADLSPWEDENERSVSKKSKVGKTDKE